ncbi:MAG: hypothetical protein HRU19_00840 [Pseudobacteriovorax sp.]|nr:hypothetical protein [Pseudobacteriovorax sp.]
MHNKQVVTSIDEILDSWREIIGKDYLGYRNHVQRMVQITLKLGDLDGGQMDKVVIAACFHDIGIWIENTVDYIEPSIPPAMEYLQAKGKHDWQDEVRLLISEHHKIRPFQDPRYPLVELFRKGDLVDFTLGAVRFGLDKEFLKELKTQFPNAGFHWGLAKKASSWFLKHPTNPAPMMKW